MYHYLLCITCLLYFFYFFNTIQGCLSLCKFIELHHNLMQRYSLCAETCSTFILVFIQFYKWLAGFCFSCVYKHGPVFSLMLLAFFQTTWTRTESQMWWIPSTSTLVHLAASFPPSLRTTQKLSTWTALKTGPSDPSTSTRSCPLPSSHSLPMEQSTAFRNTNPRVA